MYDASCIKILAAQEIEERFEWVKVERLAHEYLRDKQWIADGLEACIRCGVSQEYFIEYYLKKNKEVKYLPEVTLTYQELLKERSS